MLLSIEQSIQVVIATIGLILNVIIALIVSVGLELRSSDLKLILYIAIVDSYYYLHNLLRMLLIGIEYLIVDTESLHPEPLWWCRFDATIDMAIYLSCLESVAILSYMRYLCICKKREVNQKWFYLASFISLITNLAFSLVYIKDGYYKWSLTKLVCIVTDNPNDPNQFLEYYYYFWFANYTIRSIISLIFITISYSNISNTYYDLMSSDDIVLKAEVTSSINGRRATSQSGSQYFDSSIIVNQKMQQKLNRQKWVTTFKLIGAALAYSLCILPDIFISILKLIPKAYEYSGIGTKTLISSNLLLSSYGLINAIFVFLSHDPSKRYLLFKIECLVNDIKSYFL
ncbi:hypothetical protein K502DRAFT_352142 [Neoconidiobolus thromboides FSU 785]|nr:hypothetical protein K502DRAFT_352142 [Neoconidiobolus thromboides FSU 785]